MILSALFISSLFGYVAWNQDYTPPFTQEQIQKNVELENISEYNTYCKLASEVGILSDVQLTYSCYHSIVSQGYVRSRDKYGNLCWYNRKKNDIKFITDLV